MKRISSKVISKKTRQDNRILHLSDSGDGAQSRKFKKKVHGLRREILRFTKDLIGIATENPPGAKYSECIEFISARLKDFGLRTRIIKISSHGDRAHRRYCLLSSYGKGKKKLYFHAHYDVVPGTDAKHFKPYIRGNKLYGRGAADMKGGLAAMVYAVRAVQLLNAELDGQICLVIVPDEETGGKAGSGHLFERGYIKKEDGIGMLMPEPTSGTIWNACRGALSLSVKIRGKPVHVVLHKDGVNAFEQMVSLSAALLKYKKTVERRKTKYAVLPGESRNSILMLGGLCQCGTNFNVVPGVCKFTIERRINPEENFARQKRRLLAIFDRFRQTGMKIDLEILQEGESAGVSPDSALARVLVRSVGDVTGQRPRFNMCPGLLEIRYYLQNGIPAYAYGPGLLAKAHNPDEFVQVERMIDCASVYGLTALRLLAGKDGS
ncbi:MAG: M20 family metallopeptidase [candidate division WOR-3 bacterium]|nr:MAG: M20 family metallopeptidase [candidate division WOR-3 bacterium]